LSESVRNSFGNADNSAPGIELDKSGRSEVFQNLKMQNINSIFKLMPICAKSMKNTVKAGFFVE
jgi:hypothetical protein